MYLDNVQIPLSDSWFPLPKSDFLQDLEKGCYILKEKTDLLVTKTPKSKLIDSIQELCIQYNRKLEALRLRSCDWDLDYLVLKKRLDNLNCIMGGVFENFSQMTLDDETEKLLLEELKLLADNHFDPDSPATSTELPILSDEDLDFLDAIQPPEGWPTVDEFTYVAIPESSPPESTSSNESFDLTQSDQDEHDGMNEQEAHAFVAMVSDEIRSSNIDDEPPIVSIKGLGTTDPDTKSLGCSFEEETKDRIGLKAAAAKTLSFNDSAFGGEETAENAADEPENPSSLKTDSDKKRKRKDESTKSDKVLKNSARSATIRSKAKKKVLREGTRRSPRLHFNRSQG